MSRSRNYQRSRYRDPAWDRPAHPREDYALAYHEYLDTEGDYTTHRAWIGALIEAATTLQPARRRRLKERNQARRVKAWNRFTRSLMFADGPVWKIANLAGTG